MNVEDKLKDIYEEIANDGQIIKYTTVINDIQINFYYVYAFKDIYYVSLEYNTIRYQSFVDKIGGYLPNLDYSMLHKIQDYGSFREFWNRFESIIKKSNKNDYVLSNNEEVLQKIEENKTNLGNQYLDDVTAYYNPKVNINYSDVSAPQQVYEYLKNYGIITEYTLSALNDDVNTEKRMKRIYNFLDEQGVNYIEGPAWNDITDNFGEGAMYSIYDSDQMNRKLAGKIVEGIKKYKSGI